MWKTRLTQGKETGYVLSVILSRDDTTFVISVSDWWTLSATRHLADKALEEIKLDFKASELDLRMRGYYGPPSRTPPVWTTDLVTRGDGHDVHLQRDGAAVAVFSLEEFASLSATKFVVEDAVETAEGFAVYGRNIKEVDEQIGIELGVYEEDETDEGPVRGPWESPRKR
jgi:hypothetical protein